MIQTVQIITNFQTGSDVKDSDAFLTVQKIRASRKAMQMSWFAHPGAHGRVSVAVLVVVVDQHAGHQQRLGVSVSGAQVPTPSGAVRS